MSENTQLIHSVTYGRKVAVPNSFGSSDEFRASVQFEQTEDMTTEDIERAIVAVWTRLRELVDGEAPSYDYDSVSVAVGDAAPNASVTVEAVPLSDAREAATVGAAVEAGGAAVGASQANVAAAFPGATVEAAPSPDVGDMTADQFADYASGLPQGDVQKAAIMRRLATHSDEFWDNGPKKRDGEYSPKAPDYKWGKGASREANDRVGGNFPIWLS
jgi:hypothetical protein